MSRGIFWTTLMWHDSTGGEVEARVKVIYSALKGCPPSFYDPGSPDEIEILSITPADGETVIPDHFLTSGELIEECREDWQAEQENAAEWRAQCRRDDALMGGL
jgi:hypothetical protein